MRKLFIAVAKVFGLLRVYYGLAYVTSIIPIIQMFARTTSNSGGEVTATSFSGESLPYTLIGLVATLVLTFGVAWLLLFRTTWLADKLKIPEEQEPDGLTKDSLGQAIYKNKTKELSNWGGRVHPVRCAAI